MKGDRKLKYAKLNKLDIHPLEKKQDLVSLVSVSIEVTEDQLDTDNPYRENLQRVIPVGCTGWPLDTCRPKATPPAPMASLN